MTEINFKSQIADCESADIEDDETVDASSFMTLTQAANSLPGRPCYHTILRWNRTGVKVGKRRVRLELTKVGGRLHVSRAAMRNFLFATNTKRDAQIVHMRLRENAGRCRNATKQLEKMGVW